MPSRRHRDLSHFPQPLSPSLLHSPAPHHVHPHPPHLLAPRHPAPLARHQNHRRRKLLPLPPSTLLTPPQAPGPLALLSPAEQSKAAKYHFLRDAKLSLASSLLKRAFAARALALPWPSLAFDRAQDPTHGKPRVAPACLPPGTPAPDFNVSHQAGVVTLGGVDARAGAVGVDVTCVHERDDGAFIAREGFGAWIDMHADVFSGADVAAMKAPAEREARVRRFYAYWGLKEAYVKLVGEALLAPWLQEVEFKGVRVPGAAGRGGEGWPWGERVRGVEVWRGGVRVEGVECWLQGEWWRMGDAAGC